MINFYQCIERDIKPLHETFTRYLAPVTVSHLIDIEMVSQLNIPPLVIPLFSKTRLPLTLRIITPPRKCHLCGTFVIRANNQAHKQGVSSSFWPQRIAQTGFSTVITALFKPYLM
ncbi:hypothetical protein CF127_08400 [Aeromonas veronii]|nr:hypothetical protein CF127_08400 [Aeromonas veronii]